MYFKNEKRRQAFEAGIKKANKKDREMGVPVRDYKKTKKNFNGNTCK